MYRKTLAALVAAFLLAAMPAGAQDDHTTVVPPGCSHLYSLSYYRVVARTATPRKGSTTRHRLYRLAAMRRCARTPAAHRAMRRYTHARLADQRLWREYIALTPYRCVRFRSAIPCHHIYRESGVAGTPARERWGPRAVNPESGALGPYQFLGWHVPWPIRSFADKVAHHRMAARLWARSNGSSGGCSNWICDGRTD